MTATILAFLWECRYIIVVLVALLVIFLLEKTRFKAIAYAIMLQAKSLAKDEVLKSGQEQEDWVVNKLYQYLPKRITVFISNVMMHKIVHYLFTKGKDYLDDGKFNRSVK